MKRYLLDTNVVSELRKKRPPGAVLSSIAGLSQTQICLSAVTLGELQAGIERTRRQDPEKARELENWLESLPLGHDVLPMDAASFREWGRLIESRSGDLIEDAMIAATARVHTLIVATRNERHFRLLDVDLFNPFNR